MLDEAFDVVRDRWEDDERLCLCLICCGDDIISDGEMLR